jgi:hypothetical protein
MTCCSCCNTPVRAAMEIQTDFGSFKLDVTSRRAIYDQVEKLFCCHIVKYYRGKVKFTSDQLAKHMQDHFFLSNRDTVFRCLCARLRVCCFSA